MNHPQGIAYQLSAFSQVIKRAYSFKTRYLAACRNNRLCGVLPLTKLGFPGLPAQLISSPYCDAAGILADSPEVEAALIAKGCAMARDMGTAKMMVRNVRPFAGMNPDLTCYTGKVRMVLGLKPDPEDLLASFKSKVRSQIKKPMKEGLVFTLGGRELLPQFYQVYAENMRDLGSPPHAPAWFRGVLSGYGNRAHIGLVRLPDGTPAAAGIIFCHRTTVSIPWASSVRRYNRMNPNMLLYWRFLEFASRLGAAFFDFGRSTPGEGTYKFKSQWGALPVPLHWAVFDPFRAVDHGLLPHEPAGSETNLRHTAEQIIGRLPLSLAEVLGRLTRKYIPL